MRESPLKTVICAIAAIVFMNCSYATAPTPKVVLENEIGTTITAMNSGGHPIFISSCRSKDDNRLILVIASNGESGFQMALNKDGLITSLSEITSAPKKSDFLIEADGGVWSQANAERIFNVLKVQPFHLMKSITLEDILNPKDKGTSKNLHS